MLSKRKEYPMIVERGAKSAINFIVLFVFFSSIVSIEARAFSLDEDSELSAFYITVGGGASLSTSGFGEGFYPTAEAGVGYRLDRLEFEVDFIWSSTEWKRGVLTYPEDPGGDRFIPGHILGGCFYTKYYPFSLSSWLNLNGVLGIGSQVITILGEYSYDSGELFGLTFRIGAGAEIVVVEYISIGVTILYSYTYFFDRLDEVSPDNAGGVFFSCAFRLKF